MATVEFFPEPGPLLSRAGDYLRRHAVAATVLTTAAQRRDDEARAGVRRPAEAPSWWAVLRDTAGEVIGAAMRSAPFRPYPIYLAPMPDDAALALAGELAGRGEEVRGVNGAMPGARVCAEESARRQGLGPGAVRAVMVSRLFEFTHPVAPPRPPGRLRVAVASDLELIRSWTRDFALDVERQGVTRRARTRCPTGTRRPRSPGSTRRCSGRWTASRCT